MKKIALGIISILAFFLIFTYVFIPSKIEISGITTINCSPKIASNCINDTTAWKKWWPVPSAKGFTCNGYEYQLAKPLTDGAEITVSDGTTAYRAKAQTVPAGRDSAQVYWTVHYITGNNPFIKWLKKKEAVLIRQSLDTLFGSLKQFASKTENIYGYHIERGTFPDTLLAATKFFTKGLPSLENIYRAINAIQSTIAKQGIKQTGSPMLNTGKISASMYETMVALPVNREVKNENNISMSRMLTMKDRFLITEVVGGPAMIQKAHQQISQYMLDHILSAPAIPFEILVTDRSKEPDTSKWKTMVYYPSM